MPNPKSKIQNSKSLLLILGLTLAAGCASHADRLQPIRVAYYAGDLDTARSEIDRLLQKPKQHEADVLQLDRAMVELVSGKPKQAEKLLRQVRDRFDHFEQKDAGELALSMATDDNAVAYAGEDHEKVLLLSFLALSNLMSDGSDSTAYALQITDKQQRLIETAGGLEEHPDLARAQVALGPYVRAAVAEESALNFDDVIRARTMVVSYQPEFRDGAADLDRAKFDVAMQPENGVVYVFTLVGRGPTKEETVEVPTQAALLIADRIVSAVGKHELPPTIAPIRVPKVVRRPNRITHVDVEVNGAAVGSTTTLVDVSDLALLHAEAEYPQVTLAGIAWEATETADTRCWGLLPDKIQVLRLELPAGDHTLRLQPAASFGPYGSPELVPVNVPKGRNTYVLANFPDARLVGTVVTSSGK
jgi:hypothetical protein